MNMHIEEYTDSTPDIWSIDGEKCRSHKKPGEPEFNPLLDGKNGTGYTWYQYLRTYDEEILSKPEDCQILARLQLISEDKEFKEFHDWINGLMVLEDSEDSSHYEWIIESAFKELGEIPRTTRYDIQSKAKNELLDLTVGQYYRIYHGLNQEDAISRCISEISTIWDHYKRLDEGYDEMRDALSNIPEYLTVLKELYTLQFGMYEDGTPVYDVDENTVIESLLHEIINDGPVTYETSRSCIINRLESIKSLLEECTQNVALHRVVKTHHEDVDGTTPGLNNGKSSMHIKSFENRPETLKNGRAPIFGSIRENIIVPSPRTQFISRAYPDLFKTESDSNNNIEKSVDGEWTYKMDLPLIFNNNTYQGKLKVIVPERKRITPIQSMIASVISDMITSEDNDSWDDSGKWTGPLELNPEKPIIISLNKIASIVSGGSKYLNKETLEALLKQLDYMGRTYFIGSRDTDNIHVIGSDESDTSGLIVEAIPWIDAIYGYVLNQSKDTPIPTMRIRTHPYKEWTVKKLGMVVPMDSRSLELHDYTRAELPPDLCDFATNMKLWSETMNESTREKEEIIRLSRSMENASVKYWFMTQILGQRKLNRYANQGHIVRIPLSRIFDECWSDTPRNKSNDSKHRVIVWKILIQLQKEGVISKFKFIHNGEEIKIPKGKTVDEIELWEEKSISPRL